jgi:large subunit ribosomal protein L24
MPKLDVKKGDEVLVLMGKDRGRRGKILEVITKKNAIIVEKINVYKKHKKPQRITGSNPAPAGGIIDMPMPLPISSVRLVCKRCGKPTKVYRKEHEGWLKRYCKVCNELIDVK